MKIEEILETLEAFGIYNPSQTITFAATQATTLQWLRNHRWSYRGSRGHWQRWYGDCVLGYAEDTRP